MHYIIGAVVGGLIVAFCPAVARKVKSYFVTESKVEVAKVETVVATEAKKL